MAVSAGRRASASPASGSTPRTPGSGWWSAPATSRCAASRSTPPPRWAGRARECAPSAPSALVVKGSWFGLRLNGFAEANGNNISLEVGADDRDSDAAVIGGKRARHANVFAGGDFGVVITGGDRNRILGNRFSVNALGIGLPGIDTPIGIFGDGPDPAVGNVIGVKASRAAARSPDCDGGCNVIARANGSGIALFGGTEIPARGTNIRGNFIGLGPDGGTAFENELVGVDVATADATTIGGPAGARNYITGGEEAVVQLPDSRALTMKNNYVGFDSSGQAPLDPPDGEPGSGADFATLVTSEPEARTVVSGNRFALAPETTGLAVFGRRAEITRNVFGLRRDGSGLPPQAETHAILVGGSRNAIGRPGAGNVIANTSFAGREALEVRGGTGAFEGDRNTIRGNRIGVGLDGTPQPITGAGVALIGSADGNGIGGRTAGSENIISNVSESGIILLAGGPPFPTANSIMRNRGSGNGTTANHLFVNLRGLDGFGNSVPGPQDGIEAPLIDDATRTRVEGSAAEPGARMWIFRTRDPAGASPANIRAFVARTTANGAGNWAAAFDRIPAADRLTALQEGDEGSSELALAVEP